MLSKDSCDNQRPSFSLAVRRAGAHVVPSPPGSGGPSAGPVDDPVDISGDFHEYRNTYFLADKTRGLRSGQRRRHIAWTRNQLYPRIAFDNMENVLRPFEGVTFPEGEYAVNPTLPFSIEFVSPRAVRLRIRTGPRVRAEAPSPMLIREPAKDTSWKLAPIAGGYRYSSVAGSVTILENPWHIEFRDAQGRLLTKTFHTSDGAAQLDPILPFSFIRRASDYSAASPRYSRSCGEKSYSAAERVSRGSISAARRSSYGLTTPTAWKTGRMYKPIPSS